VIATAAATAAVVVNILALTATINTTISLASAGTTDIALSAVVSLKNKKVLAKQIVSIDTLFYNH
jgi:hypothetical protein